MVAGIPFPDIYDWTWGEIVEYINCKNEADKEKNRMDAAMYFTTASFLSKLFGGQKCVKYTVMTVYDFLWTEEEKKQQKLDKIYNSFRVAGEEQ